MPPNESDVHIEHRPCKPGNVLRNNSRRCLNGGNSGSPIITCQTKPNITKGSMPFGNDTYDKSKSTDERDNVNSGLQGFSGQERGQENGQGNCENSSGSSGRGGDRWAPDECFATSTYSDEELKKEEKRIKTFRNWPNSYVTPASLAAAGFYHVRNDLVRCVFCKIEIGKWVEGDVPMKEHKRWYGNCPFVRGKACGNVPIGYDSARASRSRNDSATESMPSYDTCGIHEVMRPFSRRDNELPSTSAGFRNPLPIVKVKQTPSESGSQETKQPSPNSLEKLGIRDMRAPKYPEYCTEAARLATYITWPLSMKQRPNTLAEAGFYYTGNGDQTICFHCGGGLKDWEEADDPWIEHAKWFSKCYFLDLVKGMDFITQVTVSRPALINAEEAKNLVNFCPTTNGASSTPSISSGNVEGETNGSSSTSQSATTAEKEEPLPVQKKEKEGKDEGRICKICYTAELGVVFLPCGHIVACVKCAPTLTVCPFCRETVTYTVRAYIP